MITRHFSTAFIGVTALPPVFNDMIRAERGLRQASGCPDRPTAAHLPGSRRDADTADIWIAMRAGPWVGIGETSDHIAGDAKRAADGNECKWPT
jgi:hypothetical protein